MGLTLPRFLGLVDRIHKVRAVLRGGYTAEMANEDAGDRIEREIDLQTRYKFIFPDCKF